MSTPLPEQFDRLSHEEQKTWFIRFYGDFREGEFFGLTDELEVPEEVKAAFAKWLAEGGEKELIR